MAELDIVDQSSVQDLVTKARDCLAAGDDKQAARLLTDADWAAVDAAIGNFNDPLFGSQVEERFAQLRNQIYRQSQVDRAIRR